jgi:hypothetical protein
VVVRADLPAGLRVLAGVVVLGAPLGLLWSWLAPPELVRVLADPVAGRLEVLPLVGQSEHRFAAMAAFVLFSMAAGVLVGAGLWLHLRRRRGPVILVAAVLGSLAAAWLAMRLGSAVAAWRYPALDLASARLGEVVARGPVLESAWVLVAQPFGAALAYSLAVAWNGTEDLGRDSS